MTSHPSLFYWSDNIDREIYKKWEAHPIPFLLPVFSLLKVPYLGVDCSNRIFVQGHLKKGGDNGL